MHHSVVVRSHNSKRESVLSSSKAAFKTNSHEIDNQEIDYVIMPPHYYCLTYIFRTQRVVVLIGRWATVAYYLVLLTVPTTSEGLPTSPHLYSSY